MSVIKLTNEDFEKTVLNSDKPVLIDFFATWCGPCQMVSPLVDEIADERDDVMVCKVDVDEARELATKFNVMSIPTLIVMKNGEITATQVGALSKEGILELLDK